MLYRVKMRLPGMKGRLVKEFMADSLDKLHDLIEEDLLLIIYGDSVPEGAGRISLQQVLDHQCCGIEVNIESLGDS